MPYFFSAPDLQTLFRKLYRAELGKEYTYGSMTLQQKHDIQKKYAIKRGKTVFLATLKDKTA